MHDDETPYPIWMSGRNLRLVLINYATSGNDRLRGLGVAGSNVAIPHRLSLSPLKRRVKRKCVIKLCAVSLCLDTSLLVIAFHNSGLLSFSGDRL